MKDILQEIVEHKRQVVMDARERIPASYLEEICKIREKGPSLRSALEKSPTGIIAEFKRRSPSKGWIHRGAEVEPVARAYQEGGASAMSVLTDRQFFGGSLEDLKMAASVTQFPLLRKDFIIDEYQLLEAKVYGADAVLLIAAALPQMQCGYLAHKAHELGLEVLLELHSPEELGYVTDDIKIVGVNNRNLGTFNTDVENSLRMAELLPAGKTLVAESGIHDAATARRLREAGYRGFLIGEAFMKHEDPGQALAQFIDELEK
ncbi:MAG: indole-3-glycerol phosphate synthase TrpC [Bacteroidales bacterium]|nr:indole-3-glycerol phosphate synthase TrpC [Bacteroidales bacterium]